MPTFVVMLNDKFMRVFGGKPFWVETKNMANRYSSKYAAKRHLKALDNVPEDVKIVELGEIKV